jgi:DNA-directed RNA polymerase specialized sigma24 family protein
MDLRSLGKFVGELTPDQRLVLVSWIDTGIGCVEFCHRFDWSKEKYRKVAQRARARLRELLAREEMAREEIFYARSVPFEGGGRREG